MNNPLRKIGLGGTCHWCMEGVFQSIKGVENIEQGWISSLVPNDEFSEAIIIHFDPLEISLKKVIEIHLITHSSSSEHAFRKKYRSAVYYFEENDKSEIKQVIEEIAFEMQKNFITQILAFQKFKLNRAKYLNYYRSNPEKPYCKKYIEPKIQVISSELKKH